MTIKNLLTLANKRRVAFLLADAFVFVLSLYLAFLVRFDGHIAPRYLSILLAVLPLAVGVKVTVLAFFRMYRFSWAYVGMEELVQTVLSCAGGSLAFAGCCLPFVTGRRLLVYQGRSLAWTSPSHCSESRVYDSSSGRFRTRYRMRAEEPKLGNEQEERGVLSDLGPACGHVQAGLE